MICFDANTILEIILDRPRTDACKELMRSYRLSGHRKDLATTMLSLDLVLYYAEREKASLPLVKALLDLFVWLPLVPDDAIWAFAHFSGKDFEDALQIGCALREDCTGFVTLDKGLAKKYGNHLKIELLQ